MIAIRNRDSELQFGTVDRSCVWTVICSYDLWSKLHRLQFGNFEKKIAENIHNHMKRAEN